MILSYTFFFLQNQLYGMHPAGINGLSSILSGQDSIRERQLLYNGIVWINPYHRIEGDQFLLSGFFLRGSVSINGTTFNGLRLKYDILSDEIITPVNDQDILQLNKEMVDSFSVSFEGNTNRFVNIRDDTLKELSGYVKVMFQGKVSLYVKHIKSIIPAETAKSDGYFTQDNLLFLVMDNRFYPFKKKRDFFRIMNLSKEQVRDFLTKSKSRISRKNPESYVPVIRHFQGLIQIPDIQ